MEKVFVDTDRFRVWQIKQFLEAQGIQCFIKNEFAIGAMGELSPLDVLPEVWLYDSEWLPKSKQLIDDFQFQSADTKMWVCAQCQEQNEANFEVCWQCADNRPDND